MPFNIPVGQPQSKLSILAAKIKGMSASQQLRFAQQLELRKQEMQEKYIAENIRQAQEEMLMRKKKAAFEEKAFAAEAPLRAAELWRTEEQAKQIKASTKHTAALADIMKTEQVQKEREFAHKERVFTSKERELAIEERKLLSGEEIAKLKIEEIKQQMQIDLKEAERKDRESELKGKQTELVIKEIEAQIKEREKKIEQTDKDQLRLINEFQDVNISYDKWKDFSEDIKSTYIEDAVSSMKKEEIIDTLIKLGAIDTAETPIEELKKMDIAELQTILNSYYKETKKQELELREKALGIKEEQLEINRDKVKIQAQLQLLRANLTQAGYDREFIEQEVNKTRGELERQSGIITPQLKHRGGEPTNNIEGYIPPPSKKLSEIGR